MKPDFWKEAEFIHNINEQAFTNSELVRIYKLGYNQAVDTCAKTATLEGDENSNFNGVFIDEQSILKNKIE